jgi:hypothetical protein
MMLDFGIGPVDEQYGDLACLIGFSADLCTFYI